jgi:putative salt-induced outer membrane protein YdiY
MHLKNLSNTLRVVGLACVVTVASALADVVVTKNGARIVGQVTKIDDGKIYVTTDYAGELVIKQSEVTGLSTETPVSVRLASGTTLQGTVASNATGITITGTDGTLSTQVDKVAATWEPSAEDPQIIAMRNELAARERHWAYEGSVDISGKSGNKNQLGTALGFRATLKTPEDTLQFYTNYNRQVTEGTKSADQFKAGADYSNNFSGRKSWYVRDELGFDRVKDIDLYNVAGAGLGYDFIKQEKRKLTGRAGLSFRYEGYKNPVTDDVKSAGLDFGLNHEWEFGNSKLVNRLSYVPAFEDFTNFTLTHESYYELPLANPSWKLRMGVSNDYNSQPGAGLDKLDTSYFTRLVLNWK